jgi:hypothetical protein
MSQTARRQRGPRLTGDIGQTASGSDVLSDLPTDRLPDSAARTARLRRAISDFRAAGLEDRQRAAQTQGPAPAGPEPVDLLPKSAHEAITRQMVTDLAADVAEVKTRVNAVLWLLASAVAIDVVMRLAGVG